MKPLGRPNSVYLLSDDREGKAVVKYVGCTHDVAMRVSQHLASCGKRPKHPGLVPLYSWLASLIAAEAVPVVEVVFTTPHPELVVQVEALYQMRHAATILNAKRPLRNILGPEHCPIIGGVARMFIDRLEKSSRLSRSIAQSTTDKTERADLIYEADCDAGLVAAIRQALNISV